MVPFSEFIVQQSGEVVKLRGIAEDLLEQKRESLGSDTGVLLSGSVARGDARVGPFGIFIDLTVFESETNRVDLESVFGPDEKPELPYHSIRVSKDIGFAIAKRSYEYLGQIQEMDEATRFALSESIVLIDPTRRLGKMRLALATISESEQKRRGLEWYRRFRYLTGDYRLEKWSHRTAWTQVAQIMNEANECYCSFLYCINGSYVPRKDWLAYLTYEMETKPEDHDSIMDALFATQLDERALGIKAQTYGRVGAWMKQVCDARGWS